jgi:hypothetical protein
VPTLSSPQLPTFLGQGPRSSSVTKNDVDPYFRLLKKLSGELGFSDHETALRWLLEQLESSADLRRLILVLLQEGER